MTARAPLKVTAILAVHNEEALVRPCLESLAAVADEILVAHDGPCKDRSLEIAREFTPHVFEHEFRGAPETNLIRLLRRASHDWILRLDCDETLSPPLIDELKRIKERGGDDGVTQYLAIWRAIYTKADESAARPFETPNRRVMYRKSCARWIGIPHSDTEVSGRAVALRKCVYHYAPHQKYGLRDLLVKKMVPFSRVDAALRLKYPIDVIGFEEQDIRKVIRRIDQVRADYHVYAAAPLAVTVFLRALLDAVTRFGSGAELLGNLRWPVAGGAYQLLLGYELRKLRKQGYVPRIADPSTRGS